MTGSAIEQLDRGHVLGEVDDPDRRGVHAGIVERRRRAAAGAARPGRPAPTTRALRPPPSPVRPRVDAAASATSTRPRPAGPTAAQGRGGGLAADHAGVGHHLLEGGLARQRAHDTHGPRAADGQRTARGCGRGPHRPPAPSTRAASIVQPAATTRRSAGTTRPPGATTSSSSAEPRTRPIRSPRRASTTSATSTPTRREVGDGRVAVGVGAEHDRPAPRPHRPEVHEAAGPGRQHDPREVVAGERQRALDQARGQHDMAGARRPRAARRPPGRSVTTSATPSRSMLTATESVRTSTPSSADRSGQRHLVDAAFSSEAGPATGATDRRPRPACGRRRPPPPRRPPARPGRRRRPARRGARSRPGAPHCPDCVRPTADVPRAASQR